MEAGVVDTSTPSVWCDRSVPTYVATVTAILVVSGDTGVRPRQLERIAAWASSGGAERTREASPPDAKSECTVTERFVVDAPSTTDAQRMATKDFGLLAFDAELPPGPKRIDVDVVPDDLGALRVCEIAQDFRRPGAPALRDFIDQRYRPTRAQLNAERVVAVLRQNPELVEDWIRFCEDKRTSSGWAFVGGGQAGWKVWQPFPEGEPPPARQHARAAEACADYVITELDYWTAVGDSRSE